MTDRPSASDIATMLAGHAEALCRELLPAGKRVGAEWRAGDVHGNAGRSLGVRLTGDKAGIWADFNSDHKKGDLLDLIGAVRGLDKKGALAWARDYLGLRDNDRASGDSNQHNGAGRPQVAHPSPESAPPDRHPTLGEPSLRHEYCDALGRVLMIHCRFDPAGRKKEFRPLSWLGGRWQWKDPPGPLPLYGLPDLAAHPNKPVLSVEGEKTAEVAREILDGYVVITWPHGANAFGKVDWSPLAGRNVTAWPDADADGGGRKAMEGAAELITKAGAARVAIVDLPDGLPDGWDLADPLPEGWDEDTVRERIVAAQIGRPAKSKPPDISKASDLPLTLDQWAARKLPDRDFLLGSIFTTTTRAMLSAKTGLGKTHLGFVLGFSMAAGLPFCHWQGRRKARVLIVDGEMSVELVKERLADAERRIGQRPESLFMLCKEDAAGMPTLDTEEGQRWLDSLIEHLGGIDFLILDNVMALTSGDLKEEESWRPVIPWMLSLTKRRIGILWINHTGHDATRSYGTSTREWQLDVVMIAEKADDPAADIAMKLSFTKARQRRPENRDDYEPVVLRLKDDAWTSESAAVEHKLKQEDHALQLLQRAIDEEGKQSPGLPAGVRGVGTDLWKKYCETFDLTTSDKPGSLDKAFERARKALLKNKKISSKQRIVWIVQ